MRRGSISCLLVVSLVLGAMVVPGAAQDGSQSESAAGLESDVTVTVTADGEIESIDVEQELPPEMGDGMAVIGEFGGSEDLAELMAETSVDADNGIDGYETARQERRDDVYRLEITFDEIDADESDDMDVTVGEDDAVSVELASFDDLLYSDGADQTQPPAMTTYGEYTAAVEMPGEITDSNADEEDGSTAIWHLDETVPDTLTVESGGADTTANDETDSAGDDGDGDDDDDGDDSLPGFGPVVAVGAVGTAILAFARR